MSFHSVFTFLLFTLFALSIARTILFNYLSQPLEGQGPRVSQALRRRFPGLARRAERARTSTEPEPFPIERRRTYRSSFRVLARHNVDLLWHVILPVLYFVYVMQDESLRGLTPWLWALAWVGTVAYFGLVAIQREAADLLAQLRVVDEGLVRSGRPARLWHLLAALLERLAVVLVGPLQALAVLAIAALVTWEPLRLARVSELSWSLLATTALVLLTFDTFHRGRLELVRTCEEAEAQLSTPSPSPEHADLRSAGAAPTALGSS